MKKKKNQEDSDFDWSSFEKEAIFRLKNGEEFGGKEGVLAPMIKNWRQANFL